MPACGAVAHCPLAALGERMAKSRTAAFEAGQREVLVQIASGVPLDEVLKSIVLLVEAQSRGMVCTILLVDLAHHCVRAGAAPTLPEAFSHALDGAPIGPREGSCGAAAARQKRIIVKDIATHPYWRKYKALALPLGLRACWSSPIFAPDHSVLGTFAMYYRVRRGPTKAEMGWVSAATHLAAIAIRHDQTTRALHQSEARLCAVVQNTPNVGIQIYDQSGHVLFCNRATQGMFGWDEQGAIGKTLDQLNFAVTEADRFLVALEKVAATGHAVGPLEFAFVHPDGRPGTLLSTVFQILANGGREFVCMDTDLTEFKRIKGETVDAEKLRKLIFENVSDAIFLLAIEPDDTFRFVAVNPAFLHDTGLAEVAVVGRTVPEVIPEPSRSLVLAKYHEAIAHGSAVTWEETTTYPSGIRYGEVAVAPLFDAEGRATRLVGTVHDITGLRKAEEERRQLELQFQQAQRMHALGTLVSGVAHDFNNILAAMAGQLDIALSQAPPAGPLRETLGDLRVANHRAKSLVRQILDFSRQQEPRRERLVLANVVDEALNLLRATLPKSLVLKTRFAADAPQVSADPTQVHQCVMNLGTNAAQATPDRAGEIEFAVNGVIVRASDAPVPGLAPGRYACLRVTDHGCGMPEALVAKIFEPFFTTKAVGEGTGLGLSVVQGIMKNHHGGIAVHSEVDRGTTFTLYFPAAAEVIVPAMPAGPAAIAAPARGAHILYVDDDPALAKLAALILRRLGYCVTVETNPHTALAVFRRHPNGFAAVVADITMPELSGPQLLGEILQIRPDVRTALVSGDLTEANRKDAAALGVRDLLLKPAGIEGFQQLVARLFPSATA
jgi:PAS domain S-box-containing protein